MFFQWNCKLLCPNMQNAFEIIAYYIDLPTAKETTLNNEHTTSPCQPNQDRMDLRRGLKVAPSGVNSVHWACGVCTFFKVVSLAVGKSICNDLGCSRILVLNRVIIVNFLCWFQSNKPCVLHI